MKELLFKEVLCHSFLKKVNDGKFIEICKGEVDEAIYKNSNDDNFEVISECCGDMDFLKTYYEIQDKVFKGFVVGIKEIVVSSYLVADTTSDWSGCEHLRIYKCPNEKIKCAIVYYQNNKKRYVPLEKMKISK